jgi:hypothetical protein
MAEPIEAHKIPPKPEVAPQPPPVVAPSPKPVAAEAAEVPVSKVPSDGEGPPPWREHLISGITHPKFHKRKIGDLNQAELQVIENQWLPAIREQWDDATDAQRTDARAFESAIAYHKMQKPW